jgi:hypothetical protein
MARRRLIWPSAIVKMWTCLCAIGRPVGAMPLNGPVCRPAMTAAAITVCPFRDGLLQFELQIRERISQPSAGCEKACRAVQLTFHVIGIVLGFLVHETRGDDLPGQLHITVFDEPE